MNVLRAQLKVARIILVRLQPFTKSHLIQEEDVPQGWRVAE